MYACTRWGRSNGERDERNAQKTGMETRADGAPAQLRSRARILVGSGETDSTQTENGEGDLVSQLFATPVYLSVS